MVFIIITVSSELILRVAGILITGGKITITNNIKKDHLRILTLGESTTDKRYLTKEKKAWPEYLEESANKKGLKIKVYNHGRASITSNEILNDLDGLLEHYKPHFVITMLGINDSDVWALNINKSYLGGLKVYRILSWIFLNIRNYFSYKPLFPKIFHENHLDIRSLNKKEESQYYAYLGRRIVPKVPLPTNIPNREDKYRKAREYYKKSIQTGYFTRGVISEYTWLLGRMNKDEECSKVIKDYIDKGGNLNYFELMNAHACFSEDVENLKYLKKNKNNISFILEENAGFLNYKKIHEKIINSGASHIIMQYPTLSIRELKDFFKSDSKTFYVENLKNFEAALKRYKKEDVFLDNFAHGFGHTTRLGHKLIAREVLKELLSIPSVRNR